jgi:hypothetical protein
MCKEAIIALIKIVSDYLPGGNEETKESLDEFRSPGRDLNPGHPQYEAAVLVTRTRL